jgi:hypothetical protein
MCWCTVPEKKATSHSSSSGTEYGETSECLHSGEWRALPAPFTNCISSIIVLYCYEVKLQLHFKMNTLYFPTNIILLHSSSIFFGPFRNDGQRFNCIFFQIFTSHIVIYVQNNVITCIQLLFHWHALQNHH